jgi:hypothetical protein
LTVEPLNANYIGEWLTSAKKYFSKTGCVAYRIGEKYLVGTAINQEYLEKVLIWISGSKENIKKYMLEHRKDKNTDELWKYFQNIIEWVQKYFSVYRSYMKGIEWDELYNAHHKTFNGNPAQIEQIVAKLDADRFVKTKKEFKSMF